MRQGNPLPPHHHHGVGQKEHDQSHGAEGHGEQAKHDQPWQIKLDGQPPEHEQAQQEEVKGVAELARLLAIVAQEQRPEHQRGKIDEHEIREHAGTSTDRCRFSYSIASLSRLQRTMRHPFPSRDLAKRGAERGRPLAPPPLPLRVRKEARAVRQAPRGARLAHAALRRASPNPRIATPRNVPPRFASRPARAMRRCAVPHRGSRGTARSSRCAC